MLVAIAMSVAAALPAAGETGVIGRLVLMQGETEIPFSSHRQALHLDLRRDAEVLEATVDADGFFIARGPPGRYRVEYVATDERAEYFAPREVELKAGQLGCVGSWVLRLKHVANDLGRNVFNELKVVDDCAALEASAKRKAGAAALPVAKVASADVETRGRTFSIVEVLTGLRVMAATSGSGGEVGGELVAGLLSDLDDGWFNLHAALSALYGLGVAGSRAGLGVGVSLLVLIELRVGASVVIPKAAPVTGSIWAFGRLGFRAFGLGARADYTPGGAPIFTVTLDLVPFYILGALL